MSKIKHEDVVDQLDQLYNQAKRQILQNQSAITGLFPSNSAEKSDASIKTSLWAASSIFALYLAYSKRVDNDQGKAHDLGQSVVKCMRGILFAWMRQSERVEAFKANQSPKHALHLKFDLHSGLANDHDFPHLQIDVVSLYLIFLAEFIASGLDIIYCMDEVTFIQNLVYYVERAYRTPDYGNWEPSSAPVPAPPAHMSNSTPVKCDQQRPIDYTSGQSGETQRQAHSHVQHRPQAQTHQHTHSHPHTYSYPQPQPHPDLSRVAEESSSYSPGANASQDGYSLEIHATSIGMAKSALEAINGCNLFGGKGANWSIIYSDIDAHSRNRSIFETLLPRESRSKNTDSYLLATISWPCFATHDPTLYHSTKSKVLRKLMGKYGLRRFLRDPYGTALADPISLADFSAFNTGGTATSNQSFVGCSDGQATSSAAHLQPSTRAGTEVGQSSATRELSFSSTTSGCSSVSVGEPPKTKQRKSSYFQRKNVPKRGQSYQSHTSLPDSSVTGQLLQRLDSATKMSKRFEHIESEWPLFVCFLIIDGIFKQDMDQIYENEKLLYERLLKIDQESGDYLMPKYYYVPQELINCEKCNPNTVERLPSAEGSSTDQLYLTGQSILLITRLLLAGLVHPNELDPLRRHMPSHDRPKRIGRYSSFQATSSDLVVQTVLIAESIRLQAMMANYGIQTQTPLEVEPVQIWSSAQLVKVYEYLGVNEKLGLKGRPSRPIGALGTSKLYRICGQTILCYPLIFEVSDFYLAQDMLLLIDDIQNELNFIGRYWRMSGRPTVCILIREEHLRDVHFRDLLDLLVQFKNGKLKKSGLRIKTGRLQNLISSSCIEHLDFLHLLPHEHLPQFQSFRQLVESPKQSLLLNVRSRATSFSASQPPTKSRRHLCSASSHNLRAIEEMSTSAELNSSSSDSLTAMHTADDRSICSDPPELDIVTAAGVFRSSSSPDLESYSMLPCNSIDYYECYKEVPTWPTLMDTLQSCTELGGQSQLLAILWEREGGKYIVNDISVEDRLEQLSQQACQARNWSVVRYCSAFLKRSVESLSPWLTSILVNGKQISLGTGANERIINNPLTPTEIHQLIYSTTSSKNPCDAVLQQEIALYIGRLISTRPDYFDGILTIRVTNFMSAMRSYLNIKTNQRKQQTDRVVHAQGEQLQPLQPLQPQEPQPMRLRYSQNIDKFHSNQNQLLDLRVARDNADNPQPSTSSSGQTDRSKPSFELGAPLVTHGCETFKPIIKVEQQAQSTPESLPLIGSHTSPGYFSRYASRSAARKTSPQGLVAKPLESLSPSGVRKLLVKVLTGDESLPISDRRQITGELCRVPKDFYHKVWSLLSCTNIGIVIGGKILRSLPTLTNMTQDDLNFALKVESLLSAIECPKLRQINVELLMALHVVLERNPEIRFENEPLDMDKVINLSLEKFRADFGQEGFGLREFYSHSSQTITLYAVRTVFDCLLPVKCKGRDSCRLS